MAGAPDPQPFSHSPFEWRLFRDATGAGLSTLVPLPGLDLLLEMAFRRRLPRTIARLRGVELDRGVRKQLGSSGVALLTLAGCLTIPLFALFWFLKRLSKKILYFLTVKETAQQLSSYWHRAYLLDHLIRSSHLQDHPEPAVTAFHQTLDEADTDSLTGLAGQVVASARRVGRFLLRTLRRQQTESKQEELLAGQWIQMERTLRTTVDHYEGLLTTLLEQGAVSATGSDGG